MTTDIFFVNKVPFFLTLSRKIYFTAVNNLADRTVLQILSFQGNVPVLTTTWFPHHDGAC
jgi:hypothetical protein